jgi:hypothetical protein
MENKDIDNYFKDRSGTFNEAPGEALWAKIEANLAPPVPSKGNAGKWLLGVAAIVILGLLAWLVIPTEKPVRNTPAEKVNVEKTDVHTPAAAVAIKDSVAKRVKVTKTPAKTGLPAAAAVNAEATTISPAADAKADAAFATAGANNVINTAITDTTADKVPVPFEYALNSNKDEVVITVTDKITPAERKKLITSTVEMNKSYAGRTIIINAKGYRSFKMVIPQNGQVLPAEIPLNAKPANFKADNYSIEIQYDTLKAKRVILPGNDSVIKFTGKVLPRQ